ncbi:MAG: 6,7-dimethyl-8-ribityllumazine synthase [Candidatus Puniceispirillales bacterium]|nr:6,7-dimethyl-8-ribityllumazine synthase [Pseudomonadota bacterium]
MSAPQSAPRYAFIKANWHSDIVDQALAGFQQKIPADHIDVYDVPGALEIPMVAKKLAESGKYAAIAGCAFVVDGGIYRHDFVAATVLDGLMRAMLDTGVPVLSVVLTPHNFQENPEMIEFFAKHFVKKGVEAADAAIKITALDATL